MRELEDGVFEEIKKELGVLVNSSMVKMPDLEAYIVLKASELCPQLSVEEQNSLKHIIKNSVNPDNAVFKLMNKRVDKLIYECLIHLRNDEAWGTRGEQLKCKIISLGFKSFMIEIQPVLSKLVCVFKHTVQVHNEHYTELCLRAIKDTEEGTKSEGEKGGAG